MEQRKSPGILYADLGAMLFQADRYEEAEDALRKALAEELPDCDRAQIYLMLARTYKALDKPRKALEAFSEAVRLDPSTFDEAREEITELTEKAVGVESRGPVFQWLAKTVSKLVPEAGSVRRMALELVEERKYDQAERMLTPAISVWPQDAELQESLGLVLLKQGNLLKSEGAFQKAIALAPGRASAHRGLGEVYNELGKYEEAVDAFGRALQKSDDPEALLGRGIALRQLNKLEASEADLQRAIQLDPEDIDLYRELAKTQQEGGKTAEAVQTWVKALRLLIESRQYPEAQRLGEEALKQLPGSGPLYLQLGRALAHQDRYEDALPTLEKAASLEPTAQVYIEIARLHYSKGLFDEALRTVDEALSLFPESLEALALRGEILHQLGRYEEALEVLNQVLTEDPEQAQVLAEKGTVLEALGEPEAALAVYQQVGDSIPWVHAQMGAILFEKGEDEEALAALNRALELDLAPNSWIYTLRGEAFYNLEQHKDAVDSLDIALQLDPYNADSSRYRGFALRKLARYEEAVRSLQVAIDLDMAAGVEEDGGTYAELGEALRVLEKPREAKKHLERAIELDPEDSFAWASLGGVQASLGQNRSALEAFNTAIDLEDGDYSWAWGSKGQMLRLGGRFEEAKDAFDRALASDPRAAWIHVERGIALWQQGVRQQDAGGYEQALSALEEALQLEPGWDWAIAQRAVCLYLVGRYEEALAAAEEAWAPDESERWINTLKSLIFEKLERNEEARMAHDQALEDPSDAMAYLDRGAEYQDFGAYERAIQDFEKAKELDPDLAEAYNVLAWLYVEYLNDNLEEATELAQKALELAKRGKDRYDEANIQDTLGWIYYKRGMLEEALPHLREASDLMQQDLEIWRHLELAEAQAS